MTQLALDFERMAEHGPKVLPFHVEQMIASLRGAGWLTAKQLGADRESDKRILRAIAEASEGQIISGQKGYKLTLEATPEDVNNPSHGATAPSARGVKPRNSGPH